MSSPLQTIYIALIESFVTSVIYLIKLQSIRFIRFVVEARECQSSAALVNGTTDLSRLRVGHLK